MKPTFRNKPTRTVIPFCLAMLASMANAEEGGTAKGTLTLEGSNGPLSVKLAHACTTTGPDTLGATKTERSIVVTAEDQATAIATCADKRCAQLAMIDGLTFYPADQGMANGWAHVGQTQMCGVAVGSALTLRVDTSDHLAGTFKIGGAGRSRRERDDQFRRQADQGI